MKFKKNDRFKVIESDDLSGQIIEIKNSTTYIVKWDHFPDVHDYDCAAADEFWEYVGNVSGGILDHYLGVSSNKNIYDLSGCPHAWKTYSGFTEQYEYCEKCDTKRK